MLDLFSDTIQQDFSWVVATFQGSGASEVIRRANEVPLKTYYPLKINQQGTPTPLWRNYLFIEFRGILTLQICRSTTKFLKIISHHDEEGFSYPVLVPKNAIDENLRLLRQGKFNSKTYSRKFYGKGSLVRVMDGVFADKKVRLETDLTPDTPGSKTIVISIGNWSGRIEIFRLAL